MNTDNSSMAYKQCITIFNSLPTPKVAEYFFGLLSGEGCAIQ